MIEISKEQINRQENQLTDNALNESNPARKSTGNILIANKFKCFEASSEQIFVLRTLSHSMTFMMVVW